MITIEPQIAQVLLDKAQSKEVMEMVSCSSFVGPFQFDILHMDCFLLVAINDEVSISHILNVYLPQLLDVYAAMACVEYLEPQDLDAFTKCVVWLRQVKNLQVPIEMVCSEESIRHYGERSKIIIGQVM